MIIHLDFEEIMTLIRHGASLELGANRFDQAERLQIVKNICEDAVVAFEGSNAMNFDEMLELTRNVAPGRLRFK